MDIIKKLKRDIVDATRMSKEGHIASAFSILDILWTLYDCVMEPSDKFVLSKGHGVLALYAILVEKGIIDRKELMEFCMFNSRLGGHPDCIKITEVEVSTGSLGHGLPMAVGMALARKVNYPLPKGEGASEVITPTNVGSSFRFLSLRSTDK